MYELQVANYENTDIDLWDFNAFKSELQRFLSEYEGVAYTEDMVKIAKKDKSTLNSVKKVIEDARKAYKARCLEPYEAIEPQIKELTGLIEERRQQIDETVKEYEGRRKAAKEKEVRKYYDRVSGSLGSDANRIWQKVFDLKWTNASTNAAKYRDEIQIAIASAARDLEGIKTLDSPFGDTLKEVYLETLSMDAVLQKNEELKEAAEKAGFTNTAAGNNGTAPAPASTHSEIPAADEAEGTLIRIHASQARLNQICDFMKAIGVTYEIV